MFAGWHEKYWKDSSPTTALKYTLVMARPMALKGVHPVHWSHMYADVTVRLRHASRPAGPRGREAARLLTRAWLGW